MKNYLNTITVYITELLASKKFTAFIVAFFVVQALWIAFSFRYPMIYDERFHVPVIKIYSEQISPFILNQPEKYDQYKNLANGSATLFHYFMSFPYRFIELFTDSQFIKIAAMRIICIALVALGLFLFYLLFKKLKVKNIFINVALFIFVLLPITPLTAATINYDNLVFPLVAGYLLVCVRIIQAKKPNWLDFVGVIGVGCFVSLIKYSFLPIFAISALYLIIVSFYKWRSSVFTELWRSIKFSKKPILIPVLIIAVLVVGLFSAKYIRNIIIYHTPQPSCIQTLGKERCLKSGIVERNFNARQTKDQRPLLSPPAFTLAWYKNMTNDTMFTGNSIKNGFVEFGRPLPVMQSFLFFGIIAGLGFILYAWRDIFSKRQEWRFLFTVAATLVVAVFLVNFKGHLETHALYAHQPRYMLPVVPILLVAIVLSVNLALAKKTAAKLILLGVVCLIFTQGGGAITHVIRSNDPWYWDNQSVIKANKAVKKVMTPFVKESYR